MSKKRGFLVVLAFSALVSLMVLSGLWKDGNGLESSSLVGSARVASTAGTFTTLKSLEKRQSAVAGASYGLFTTERLEKGAFIGFYCGDHYRAGEENEIPEERVMYTFGPADGKFIVPDPSNERHKLCFLNESPEEATPNIQSERYFLYKKGKNGSLVPSAIAIAMYATRKIEGGSELYFYYGSVYEPERKKKGYSPNHSYTEFSEGELEDPAKVLKTLPLDCFVAI